MKSFFLFIVLVALHLVRERYEKITEPVDQRKKSNIKNKNMLDTDFMLGRAFYLPLIFLCFTVFMLNKLSGF